MVCLFRIIRVTYGFPRPNTKSWFQPNFYFTAFNDETEYESSNMQLSPTRITTTAPTIKALAKRVHKGDPREFLG